MRLKVILITFNVFCIIGFTIYNAIFFPNYRQLSSINDIGAIETLRLDFKDFIETYSYTPENQNSFQNKDYAAINLFKLALERLIDQDLEKTQEFASAISYNLFKIIDSGNNDISYYCLVPAINLTSHQGLFCTNPEAIYNHHVAAPHPIIDFKSNSLAVDVFRENSFMFFSVASANRCSSDQESICDGETSVCGKKGAYRISDLAHNISNFFHEFSIFINDFYEDSIHFQIHSCGNKTCPKNVIARISNGTNNISQNSISNILSSILNKALFENNINAQSRSCNLENEPDYKLCATTNVQGRYINGSKEPCVKAAENFNNRFIHIETNYELRTNNSISEIISPKLLTDAINKLLLNTI